MNILFNFHKILFLIIKLFSNSLTKSYLLCFKILFILLYYFGTFVYDTLKTILNPFRKDYPYSILEAKYY